MSELPSELRELIAAEREAPLSASRGVVRARIAASVAGAPLGYAGAGAGASLAGSAKVLAIFAVVVGAGAVGAVMHARSSGASSVVAVTKAADVTASTNRSTEQDPTTPDTFAAAPLPRGTATIPSIPAPRKERAQLTQAPNHAIRAVAIASPPLSATPPTSSPAVVAELPPSHPEAGSAAESAPAVVVSPPTPIMPAPASATSVVDLSPTATFSNRTVIASGSSEIELLHRAWDARAHDPAQTLALVREDEQLHPNGALAEERDALAITALAKLHQLDAARAAATRFFARHPDSVHRAMIESSIDSASGAPAVSKALPR